MRFRLVFISAVLWGTAFFLSAQDSPRPSFFLDAQDRPWAAWVERLGLTLVARAARWDGAAWRSLGGVLNTDSTLSVASIVLAKGPQGEVWASWGEKPVNLTGKDVGAGRLHVARWTGEAWAEAPSPSRSAKTVSDRPVLRIDSQGRPWVVWSEITPDFNVDNVYLAVLEPAGWRLVDDGSLTTDVSSAGRSRDLALTKNDEPILAYSKLIYHHDFQVFAGTWRGRWTPFGETLNSDGDAWAGFPSLVLTPEPLAAFVQAGDSFRIKVRQWAKSGWVALDDPGGPGARNPRIAFAGVPYLLWIEPGRGLVAARWQNRWQELGTPISTPGAFVDTAELAIDSLGRPWTFWAEDDAHGQRMRLSRWDGSTWSGLPSPPFLPKK